MNLNRFIKSIARLGRKSVLPVSNFQKKPVQYATWLIYRVYKISIFKPLLYKLVHKVSKTRCIEFGWVNKLNV